MTDVPSGPSPPGSDTPAASKQAGRAKSLFADIADDLDNFQAAGTVPPESGDESAGEGAGTPNHAAPAEAAAPPAHPEPLLPAEARAHVVAPARDVPAAPLVDPSTHRPPSHVPARRRGSRTPWMIAAGAAVAAAVVVALAVGPWGPFATRVNSSSWTAVLLTGNDVFFGHVRALSNDRIELSNVYYVQKPAGTAPQSQALSVVSLVANQIQCPKDDITINRADVAYWEELQESSFVVQRLNQLSQTTQTCYQPPAASPGPSAAGAPAPPQPSAAPTPAASPTPAR